MTSLQNVLRTKTVKESIPDDMIRMADCGIMNFSLKSSKFESVCKLKSKVSVARFPPHAVDDVLVIPYGRN